MTNETLENNGIDVDVVPSNQVMDYIWISGIILSSMCLILQLLLLMYLPKIRQIDQKILLQLTIARLANTVLEYVMTHLLFNKYTKDVTFTLYLQTDAVLICWMSTYTKHLYDKVVIVLLLKQWKFIYLSPLIWILPLPVGILWSVCDKIGCFYEYYAAFAWLKLIVLSINLLVFSKIFYVIIKKGKNARNFADIVKTCVISFILLSITSLQALLQCILMITDILDGVEMAYLVFECNFVLNSLHAVGVTIIFLILAKNFNSSRQ